MFERFTDSTRATVMRAVAIAVNQQDHSVDCRHLLEALLDAPGVGTVLRSQLRPSGGDSDGEGQGRHDDDDELLASLGIDVEDIRRHVDKTFGPGAFDAVRDRGGSDRSEGRPGGWRRPFDCSAKTALERSLRHALRLRCRSIGPVHLALAVLDDEQFGLTNGVDPGDLDRLRSQLEAMAVARYGDEERSRWWRRAG